MLLSLGILVGIMYIILNTGKFTIVLIYFLFFGIPNIPAYGLLMGFGLELTYPI